MTAIKSGLSEAGEAPGRAGGAVVGRPAVLQIPPLPAEALLPEPEGAIGLNTNENRLGASPMVAAALKQDAEAALTSFYPAITAAPLCRALEDLHDLQPGQVLAAGGGELLLPLAVLAFAGVGDEVAYFGDGFMKFRGYILTSGATPVAVERGPDAVTQMLSAITPRTRIVLLDNPANPSGRLLPAEEIARLRAGLPPGVLLMLDEAYIEFADVPRLGLNLLQGAENVIVFRTLSKAYGLAGLRVGWAAGAVGLMQVLARVLPTFPVPRPSLAGALAALEDQAHMDTTVERIRALREASATTLRAAGWDVPPSQGNFLLLRSAGRRDALAAVEALAGAGILVRGMADFGGVPALRITIGTEPEMARALAVLTG